MSDTADKNTNICFTDERTQGLSDTLNNSLPLPFGRKKTVDPDAPVMKPFKGYTATRPPVQKGKRL